MVFDFTTPNPNYMSDEEPIFDFTTPTPGEKTKKNVNSTGNPFLDSLDEWEAEQEARRMAWDEALGDSDKQSRKEAWDKALKETGTKNQEKPKTKTPQKTKPLGMGDLRAIEQNMPEANINTQFIIDHPTAHKVLNTISAPVRKVFNNPFIQRSSQAANEVRFLTDAPEKVTTGSPIGDMATDFIGGMAGFISAPGVPSLGGQIFNAGAKATGKLLPTATKPIFRTGAQMGGGGVAYDMAHSLSNDAPVTPSGIGTAAAQNFVLGALTHGAAKAIPKLFPGNTPMEMPKIEGLDLSRPAYPLLLPQPKTTNNLPIRNIAGMLPEYGTGSPIPRPGVSQKALPISGELAKVPNIIPAPLRELTPPTTAELNNARQILKNTKNVERAEKLLNTFPELQSEFPGWMGRIKRAKAQQLKQKPQQQTVTTPPAMETTPEPMSQTSITHDIDATQLKDLGGYRLYMTDIYRNIADTFGPHSDQVKQRILDPFDDAKKANIEFQHEWLNRLKNDVVKGLGIKKGSKLSELIQKYGEGEITLQELKRLRPLDWQKVTKANDWFRNAYDNMIDQVNAVRAQIYPNNPDKLVPRRDNYFRHFQEMAEGFGALKNIFDTPAQIDPTLAGVSDYTLPKTKWASFMQKRGMGPFKRDAVGGFLNYLPSASHAVHLDPHIGRFEKLADELAETTKDSRNLNNFIEYLRDFSRDLAGKTNPADRFVQKIIPGGRKTFQALNWLNNRVKANTVLGNASSALAQVANVPAGIAFAKQHSIPGMGRTLKQIFTDNNPIKKSGFLKERYGGVGSKMYRQFDTDMVSKPRNFAVWVMETADRLGSSFIWNSAYSKAVSQKIKDPIRFADNTTRRLVAGRGVGEVPILQKARVSQLIIPFQLEVANLWSVQRDFIKQKDFSALATLYLASFLFNRAMEKVKGNGVIFDPVQAMLDAVTEDELTPLQRAGRLAGEVFSNVPFGQTLANSSLFPEYGGNVMGIEMPSRKELFGRQDPTRFGSGLLVGKGLQDPLTKILPPFAGNQLKKTSGALDALVNNGVYTSDFTQLKYPIATDPLNITKGLLFGPGGFREGLDYYRNSGRPLTEVQTKEFERKVNAGMDPERVYRDITLKRDIRKIQMEIANTRKDKTLTASEKAKKIQALTLKRMELLKQ